MRWFKAECFTWVNTLPCGACECNATRAAGMAAPMAEEAAHGAGRVELHVCPRVGGRQGGSIYLLLPAGGTKSAAAAQTCLQPHMPPLPLPTFSLPAVRRLHPLPSLQRSGEAAGDAAGAVRRVGQCLHALLQVHERGKGRGAGRAGRGWAGRAGEADRMLASLAVPCRSAQCTLPQLLTNPMRCHRHLHTPRLAGRRGWRRGWWWMWQITFGLRPGRPARRAGCTWTRARPPATARSCTRCDWMRGGDRRARCACQGGWRGMAGPGMAGGGGARVGSRLLRWGAQPRACVLWPMRAPALPPPT